MKGLHIPALFFIFCFFAAILAEKSSEESRENKCEDSEEADKVLDRINERLCRGAPPNLCQCKKGQHHYQ